ncbi:hypothetical protein [Candidatus Nanohalococcus occultus]|uniref:hypothetical protein n=1 Tax=Candidatus Nanohalococcus occultus TaxID=2978047 RepID=UPI0039DFE807
MSPKNQEIIKSKGFNLLADEEGEVIEADKVLSESGNDLRESENSAILTNHLTKFEGKIGGGIHSHKPGEPNVIAAKNFSTNPDTGDDIFRLKEWTKGLAKSIIPGSRADFGYIVNASKEHFIDRNFYDESVEIDDNIAFFTQTNPSNLENVEGTENISKFGGDWEDLTNYLSESVPAEEFQFLNAFNLRNDFRNIKELQSFVSEYSSKYDEIKDKLNAYKELKRDLNLEDLDEDNETIYNRLIDFDEEVDGIIKSAFDISDSGIDALNKSNNKMYVSRSLSDLESRLEGEETTVDDFLETFTGDIPDEFLLEPSFKQRYFTDGESTVDSKDEANEAFYEKGIDQLERIARGQGEISLEEPQIDALEQELRSTISEIKSSDGRPSQDLIEKKNQLKQQITEEKREKAFEDLSLDYESENPDYSDLSPLEVRKALDQLGQEYLENCSAEEEATEIASNIDVSDDVGNGYVDFEVWDKSLETLPHDDRSVPCSFPGGSREEELFGYMLDSGTQITKLEAGADKGAVISNIVECDGEDYLFVHSVESDDAITSRNDISLAIKQHIEDYAHKADLEGVVYSTDSHNSAANDFVNALEQEFEYEEQELELSKYGDEVFLDVEFPEVNGYMCEV